MKLYDSAIPDAIHPQPQTPLAVQALGGGATLFVVTFVLLGLVLEVDMTRTLKTGAILFCAPLLLLTVTDTEEQTFNTLRRIQYRSLIATDRQRKRGNMRTKQNQNLDIDPAVYNRVRPFIALDLEVASPFPEEGEWWEGDLLGISCVGLYSFPHNASVTYMPETIGGEPVGPMMGRMSAKAVEDLVETLWWFHTQDEMDLVTWNGAGFDWRCLWLECASPNARKLVKRMAREHQDPAYQMLCEKGFMVGLEKAADATCGVRKTEGVSGKLAPQMWASGDLAEQERVLDYVAQDALITAQLYAAVCQDGLLKWNTSRGTVGEWVPKRFNHGKRFRMMSVAESGKFPLPDTSWLTEPWPREKFTGWLQD